MNNMQYRSTICVFDAVLAIVRRDVDVEIEPKISDQVEHT